jgi:hypothetical protein
VRLAYFGQYRGLRGGTFSKIEWPLSLRFAAKGASTGLWVLACFQPRTGLNMGNWPGFKVVTFATTRQNEVSGCAESEALMPHRIAEQLLQVAKTCRRLAAESKDKDITRELEAVAADLSAKAKKLEDLYEIIEAT